MFDIHCDVHLCWKKYKNTVESQLLNILRSKMMFTDLFENWNKFPINCVKWIYAFLTIKWMLINIYNYMEKCVFKQQITHKNVNTKKKNIIKVIFNLIPYHFYIPFRLQCDGMCGWTWRKGRRKVISLKRNSPSIKWLGNCPYTGFESEFTFTFSICTRSFIWESFDKQGFIIMNMIKVDNF